MHIYTDAVTIRIKENHEFGRDGKGHMGNFEGEKERKKCKLFFQKLEKYNYKVYKKMKDKM